MHCSLQEARPLNAINSPQELPVAAHKLEHSQATLFMVVSSRGGGRPAGASGGDCCCHCGGGASPPGAGSRGRALGEWARRGAHGPCR